MKKLEVEVIILYAVCCRMLLGVVYDIVTYEAPYSIIQYMIYHISYRTTGYVSL